MQTNKMSDATAAAGRISFSLDAIQCSKQWKITNSNPRWQLSVVRGVGVFSYVDRRVIGRVYTEICKVKYAPNVIIRFITML